MEIKYEPVFGDYKFSNDTCEIAMRSSFGEIIEMAFTQPIVIPEGWGMIAMRRIIRTPTWTVADQKAGKLPEVGCRVNFCHKLNTDWRTGEIKYIDDQVVVIKADDVARPFVYEVERVEFKPIESPEEKAARLREEWCIKALSSCSISSEMQRYELKRLGGYIEDIYDALKSGELPMPGKWSE